MKYNYIDSNEKLTYFQSKWKSAQPRKKVTKVVIHDYAGGESLTAKNGASSMVSRMKNNGDSANVHWVIDAKECYAVIPEKQSAYATGNMGYNQCTLNIEIAPSFADVSGNRFRSQESKNNYYKSWTNACKLAADICVKYGLGVNDIIQHRNIVSTACPYTMNVYFGGYDKALSETRKQTQKEIDKLKGVSKPKPKVKTFYFKDEKITRYKQTLTSKDGKAKAQAQYTFTCIKDTKCYRDFEATKVDGSITKGQTLITTGSKGFNKKGYWMNEIVTDNGKYYVCYYSEK